MDITIHSSFLPQTDPEASLAFYRDAFGFEVRLDVGQGTMRQAIAEMPQQSGRVIGERLRLRHRLTAHEIPFMKQHARGVFKVTMPATS